MKVVWWGLCLFSVAGIWFLHEHEQFPSGAYAVEAGLFGAMFAAQLAILVVGLGISAAVPAGMRPKVLIVQGLLCLGCLGPIYAGGTVVLLAVFTLGCRHGLRWPVRLLLWATVLAALYVAAAQRLNAAACLFSMMFGCRMITLAIESAQRGFPARGATDLALYFLVAPMVVFPSYLAIIPTPHETRAAAIKPPTAEQVKRAALHLLLAGFYTGLSWALLAVPAELRSGFTDFLDTVFAVCRFCHAVYALMMLHGVHCRAPLNFPLLSTTYVELWSRWQIHLKDFQVRYFYLPALMRLRKMNRYLAIMVALAFTLVIVNTLVHLGLRYAFGGGWQAMTLNALRINCFNTVVLGATLCFDEWRRRAKRPAPQSPVWKALGWLGTMAAASLT